MDLRTKKHNTKTVNKAILNLTEEHLKDGDTILLDIGEKDLLQTNSHPYIELCDNSRTDLRTFGDSPARAIAIPRCSKTFPGVI